MGGDVNKTLSPQLREERRLLKQDLGLAVKGADEASPGSLASASDQDVSARASKAREPVASMKRRIAEIEAI
jgi:hypothetical protein